MKRLRKIMALAFSMVLGVGTMMPAFAADGDLTVDEKISVTGLESGDFVTAYQFVTWVDGTDGKGWKLAEGITDITIDDITDGLDVDELAILANNTNKMTKVVDSEETNSATWEMTCGTVAKAGSYLILVNSGTAEHIYNPAVVSADFDGTNNDALDLTADDATIKKQDVTILKEANNAPDDYDVQVGDIVPFTVTVTVPQYNTNWTAPYFAVSDTLSTGLTISDSPTIEGLTAGTDYILKDGAEGDSGFTITFTDNYLKNNAQTVLKIKYSALVGEKVMDEAQVHEETNKVKLEFSNNPSKSDDHKTVDDETHHYTFAIDATRLGQGSEKTNELIKVGVDKDGNQITVYKEGEELPTGVTPLEGAVFTLTGTGANGAGEVELTGTSDEDGRIYFNNLEVGSYTLKETSAPAGYIKDQTSHTVVVSAEYNEDTTLKSYTITIDGEATSTYTATTNSDNVTTYEAPNGGNQTFPINNKKGTELPSTGGIGTTVFYIVGGGMVAGAVVFLLTKRRIASND
jgi:fimbrial isopeptide formation D2 family protein/LPXTG-motif cell wall-anchored protein